METFDKLKEILVDIFSVPSDTIFKESVLLSDLGLDDLDVVEFFIEVEDHFKLRVDIPDTITTVDELIKYVDENKS